MIGYGKHTKSWERGKWLILIERVHNSFDFLIFRKEFNILWWRKEKDNEVYQYIEFDLFEKNIFHKVTMDKRKKYECKS